MDKILFSDMTLLRKNDCLLKLLFISDRDLGKKFSFVIVLMKKSVLIQTIVESFDRFTKKKPRIGGTEYEKKFGLIKNIKHGCKIRDINIQK